MSKKNLILISFFLLFFNYVTADADDTQVSAVIKNFIIIDPTTNKISCNPIIHCDSKHTASFYKNNNYQNLWSNDAHILPQTQSMLDLLKNSNNDGLDPNYYHLQALNNIYTLINNASNTAEQNQNIAMFDMILTDGVFLYLHDLAYGHTDYKKDYPNWSYESRNINLDNVLLNYLQTNDINTLLTSVLPTTKLYFNLRDQLAKYQGIAMNGGFPLISGGSDLKIGSRGYRVKELQNRLVLSGELGELYINPGVFDHNLKKAVLAFQKNNGIKATGIVDKHTLNILNINVNNRIKIIANNLDRIRMMPLNTNNDTILVNIPDYNLTLWNSERPLFSMMAIVGDKKHRSCVLNSQVSYLEINPYWNIPRSIAVKELLPKIMKDPNYLVEKNIDTFLIESSNHIQIDPRTVDWGRVDTAHFNYFFRQNPGKDNALGHIKFMFPNNCGIYLHDTDEPNLFDRKKRDLSHGCIRISKPIELATYLLQNKPNWNESAIESAIEAGHRRVVTLKTPEDVAITYLTSWVNESGILQFRPDIYGLDTESSAVMH